MDPDKLAGINLPAEEPFVAPEDVLEGNHRPRGEILHYGEQLIMEVYEDDAATFNFGEPSLFDEFVQVLSGKLILTGTDGVSQEFVAGDSLVVPKGFTGTWKMLGNYRELSALTYGRDNDIRARTQPPSPPHTMQSPSRRMPETQ